MSNGNSVRFGTQIAKKFVLGAATSTGVLTPFFVAGYVIKRKIRKTLSKGGEDFFTRLMKEAKTTVEESVMDVISDNDDESGTQSGKKPYARLSRDAMTQTFDETAEDK